MLAAKVIIRTPTTVLVKNSCSNHSNSCGTSGTSGTIGISGSSKKMIIMVIAGSWQIRGGCKNS